MSWLSCPINALTICRGVNLVKFRFLYQAACFILCLLILFCFIVVCVYTSCTILIIHKLGDKQPVGTQMAIESTVEPWRDLVYWIYVVGERRCAGPFQQLNAESIELEVGDMFRTMYKLTKVFSDQPGPRNVTDRLRNKIEKFRQHQPLLNIICNPGIRDRHWEQVCYQSSYLSAYLDCFIVSLPKMLLHWIVKKVAYECKLFSFCGPRSSCSFLRLRLIDWLIDVRCCIGAGSCFVFTHQARNKVLPLTRWQHFVARPGNDLPVVLRHVRNCLCIIIIIIIIKWHHGRHLESMTSNRKSDCANRCVFTWRAFLPNFIPIRFEMTEP